MRFMIHVCHEINLVSSIKRKKKWGKCKKKKDRGRERKKKWEKEIKNKKERGKKRLEEEIMKK